MKFNTLSAWPPETLIDLTTHPLRLKCRSGWQGQQPQHCPPLPRHLLATTTLTLSLPRCYLKRTIIMQNGNLSAFFVLALPSGKISVRTILKVELLDTGTRKYTVCRHVCGLFSPEIIRAGVVKGLRPRAYSINCNFSVTVTLFTAPSVSPS